MTGSARQRQAGIRRCCALIALLFLVTSCSSAPVDLSPDSKVSVFTTQTEEWVQTRSSQVKPGSEFTFDGHLYRSDDAGRAEIVPNIDSGKLERADRPYDSSSFTSPRNNDAVQVLDAGLRVTRHAVLSKAEPRSRLCFHGRVYYLEASRNLAYRGVVTIARTPSGLEKTLVRSQPIEITQSGLRHVVDRHTSDGSSNAGKSVFYLSESLESLIRDAVYWMPTPSRGNMQRVIDAGRPIGIYRSTGKPTNVYTVITTTSGKLVTAFPGPP